MERRDWPALTPLEGALLPAIEMKTAPGRRFAALHAALKRWNRPLETAPIQTKEAPAQLIRTRALQKAAYAYAVKKGKR